VTAYLEAVPRPRGRSGREAVVITDRLVTVHVVHDVEVTHLVLRRRPAPAQLTTGYQWPPQAGEGVGAIAAQQARHGRKQRGQNIVWLTNSKVTTLKFAQ